jgi:hypothetical protein
MYDFGANYQDIDGDEEIITKFGGQKENQGFRVNKIIAKKIAAESKYHRKSGGETT